MNILYTLNDKFVPQVSAGICSVCENNKDAKEITFYIVSKEITQDNKNKMKELVERYNRKIVIKELGDIKSYFDFEFDTTGWNSIVLARLLLDKILPEDIDKILYIDGDTIVRGSLKQLWDTSLENYIIGASIEPTINKKRKQSLNLEGKPYYNAGVLLINLENWRKEGAGQIILNYYRDNNGKLFANDQDAINGALSEKIKTISPTYNFYNIFYQYSYRFLKKIMKPAEYIDKEIFEEAVKNPTIIHYLGEERPWRDGNKHKYKSDYIKYLNMTYWKDTENEHGWKTYFFFWYIFNFVTKPFPIIRYKIIDFFIPTFIKIRAKNANKNNTK